jgi:hypothetical protein
MKILPLEKQALMLRRTGSHKSNCPDISTKNLLMSMVLTDLANLNQKKITGDSKVQNSFQIVTALKLKCALTKHTTTLKKSLPTFS